MVYPSNVMKKDFSKETRSIKLFSKNVRSKILDMAYEAGSNSSHFGGALSIVEIISTLFSYQMKIDKKNPEWNERDRFILSKGHACLAYYAALSEVGYMMSAGCPAKILRLLSNVTFVPRSLLARA